MAVYASMLIIEKQTDLRDSEILESLELFKLKNSVIGEENTKYLDCFDDFNKIYVCSTKHLVFVTGISLIEQFYKLHQIPFIKFVESCKFLFFSSETVSMEHILCYGEKKRIERKKIVKNGKYFIAQRLSDIGELHKEEHSYFKTQEITDEIKSSNSSYLWGENDFDIALNIARKKFPALSYASNRELDEFLNTLTFNKEINVELSDEYKQVLKTKLKRGELKRETSKFFSNRLKIKGFKKETYKAPAPRDIGKNIRFFEEGRKYPIYFEYLHLELYQISKLLLFINSELYLEVNLRNILTSEPYITLKCDIPFYSFQIGTKHQIITKCRDKIFIKRELNAVFDSLNEELEVVDVIQSLLKKSLQDFFTSSYLWNSSEKKIKQSVYTLGKNEYKPELNFCLAHIYFTNNETKFNKLKRTLAISYSNLNKTESADLEERLSKLEKEIKK